MKMRNIRSILIISYFLVFQTTAFAQNDNFFVMGLPKETLSNKVKICNVYSVSNDSLRNLELTKKYDVNGLLNLEINYNNSNITKYKYNEISRIVELTNINFKGSDTSLILNKSINVFFYNNSKYIVKKETTQSSGSNYIIHFIYDKDNRIMEKKCINDFDSLIWAVYYSYDTLYNGIVEVKVTTSFGTNKEYIDNKGQITKSISSNSCNFYLYNNANLQRMYEQISFDTNGEIDFIVNELYFYDDKDLLSQKEVHINGQFESVYFFLYNDDNLLDKVKVAKDDNFNSARLIEIYEYEYYR